MTFTIYYFSRRFLLSLWKYLCLGGMYVCIYIYKKNLNLNLKSNSRCHGKLSLYLPDSLKPPNQPAKPSKQAIILRDVCYIELIGVKWLVQNALSINNRQLVSNLACRPLIWNDCTVPLHAHLLQGIHGCSATRIIMFIFAFYTDNQSWTRCWKKRVAG